eukprot:SM000130S27075  [mRNA]  locus=s130:36435:39651:+ [translate_table: standard]
MVIHSIGYIPILLWQRARSTVIVCRAAKDGAGKDDKDKELTGLFRFVTDNPSSKGGVYLDQTAAESGNVGQMVERIKDKGREKGRNVQAGKFSWFVREYGGAMAKQPVLFLHGSPTQGYSYRAVMEQLAKKGYKCYAPDWIGFGFSEKPQPGYDFSYTEQGYHEELDKLIGQLGIKDPVNLVVQGFILGSYGLTWALKNQDRVAKLGILNTPLTPSASLPPVFSQLRLPFVGEFTSQNAILPERFIEKGSPYVLENDDADVYRLPYLDSSDAGFSLLESARKAPVKDMQSRIQKGFAAGSWDKPTMVAWGEKDRYLPKSEALAFAEKNPSVVKASILEGAGHLPQEDWPEKVVEQLVSVFGQGRRGWW